MGRCKTQRIRCLLVGLLVLAWLAAGVSPIQAADIYWTGQGDGMSWSDTGNWDLGRLPDSDDVVYLGYDIGSSADAPQNINLDVLSPTNFNSIMLQPTGMRAVNLNGNPFRLINSPAITMTASAETNAVIQQSFVTAASFAHIRNDSLAAELSVAGGAGGRGFYGDGITRITGQISSSTRFYDTRIIADSATLIHQSAAFWGTILYLARDTQISRQWSGTDSWISVIGSDDNLSIVLSTYYGVSGTAATRIYLTESPDGSQGNVIARVGKFNANSLELVTIAGSAVEFYRDPDAAMEWSDNAGISGAGDVWKTSTGVFEIKRAMAYTGRTMLQNGILRLATHVVDEGLPGEITYYGQLPPATVVELGGNAILDLNGIAQQVGGLSGFRGINQSEVETFGELRLNGAELTVNAADTATAFAGTIDGEGALVKTGVQTFTLSAGYTNIVGRALRVEDGLLEVMGMLDIEEGAFHLAGGRVAAGELYSTGTTWNVVLDDVYEGVILVDIGGEADITDAALNLSLAPDYVPEIGATYTLLRADNITGAAARGNLFQYQDGRALMIDDRWFRIKLEPGSENIVLTAIPELVGGMIIKVR